MSDSSGNIKDPNESKEVSILKRNLRLVKRIVLGKNRPSIYLRVLCWIFLTWSLIMALGNLFIFTMNMVTGQTSSIESASSNGYSTMGELPTQYFISYSFVHLVAIIGVVLMYRKKVFGFYIFALATLLMPFWSFFYTKVFEFNLYITLFSIISVVLFALHFYVFAPKKKKEIPEDATQQV
jgi:hypothetical protein